MSEFPKHEVTSAPRKKKQPQPAVPAVPVAPTFPDNLFLSGLDALEMPLEKIAHTFKSYHANLCDGNLALALFTDPDGHPVKVQLDGENIETIATALDCSHDALSDMAKAAERIATAFERIATAMEAHRK